MKKWLKRTLTVVLAATLVAGVALALWQYIGYSRSGESQAYAQQVAFSGEQPILQDAALPLAQSPAEEVPAEPQKPLPEEAAFLLGLDLPALQNINEDVMGWITIPGTETSYPLLESSDRDEYLYHNWQGQYDLSGSIFLENRNSRDFSDFNTIIYGHHMVNGTMFGALTRYKDQENRDAHPYIYIATENSILQYQVFGAWEASVESDAYRLVFRDDIQKQTALDTYLSSSVWDSEQMPTVQDRILTLSTCTGRGHYYIRWVVQAVLVGQWER